MLYVAWEETGAVDATVEGPWEDAVLSSARACSCSTARRTAPPSHHALKHHLPEGTALLVAPLAARPQDEGHGRGHHHLAPSPGLT